MKEKEIEFKGNVSQIVFFRKIRAGREGSGFFFLHFASLFSGRTPNQGNPSITIRQQECSIAFSNGTPMNFKKPGVATQIVTIPRRMHREDKSPFALLKETGYFELHDQLSVSDIREALNRDPECVQEWLQYVDDLRCPASWYFDFDGDENQYEVGFFDIKADPNRSNRVRYDNATDACAAYIKREIESMRSAE